MQNTIYKFNVIILLLYMVLTPVIYKFFSLTSYRRFTKRQKLFSLAIITFRNSVLIALQTLDRVLLRPCTFHALYHGLHHS